MPLIILRGLCVLGHVVRAAVRLGYVNEMH